MEESSQEQRSEESGGNAQKRQRRTVVTTNEEKMESKNKYAAMVGHSTKASLTEVLPFKQAFLLRGVSPQMLASLHKALMSPEVRQNISKQQEDANEHVEEETAEETNKSARVVMLHWSTKDGVDTSRTVSYCIRNDISAAKTTLFDGTMTELLVTFSQFLEVLLKKEFEQLKDHKGVIFFSSFRLVEVLGAYHQQYHYDPEAASILVGPDQEKVSNHSWEAGYSVYLPLFFEGMALRILHHKKNRGDPNPIDYTNMIDGAFRVNFGDALLVRNDVPRAGHYGSNGNLYLRLDMLPTVGAAQEKRSYGKEEFLGTLQGQNFTETKEPDCVLYNHAENIPKSNGSFHRYGNEFLDDFMVYDTNYVENISFQFAGAARNNAFGGWASS